MWVETTTIMFTPEGLIKVNSIDLPKLDSGFFNLYLTSTLHLSKGTIIRDITAQKSIVNAISQSSVYMSEDV